MHGMYSASTATDVPLTVHPAEAPRAWTPGRGPARVYRVAAHDAWAPYDTCTKAAGATQRRRHQPGSLLASLLARSRGGRLDTPSAANDAGNTTPESSSLAGVVLQ
jgi:hypothetical protein